MKPAIRIIFAPLYKRNPLEYRRGRLVVGYAQNRTIRLDPREPNILKYLVHEMQHVKHPDWTERMVEDYVKLWLKKTSWKKKAAYLKLLGSAQIEGESS